MPLLKTQSFLWPKESRNSSDCPGPTTKAPEHPVWMPPLKPVSLMRQIPSVLGRGTPWADLTCVCRSASPSQWQSWLPPPPTPFNGRWHWPYWFFGRAGEPPGHFSGNWSKTHSSLGRSCYSRVVRRPTGTAGSPPGLLRTHTYCA